jgi:hypothetical protein
MFSSSKYEFVRVGTSIKRARMLILVSTHGTVILLGHSRSSCGPTRKAFLLIPVAIERFYHCSVSKVTTGHAVLKHKELCVLEFKKSTFFRYNYHTCIHRKIQSSKTRFGTSLSCLNVAPNVFFKWEKID